MKRIMKTANYFLNTELQPQRLTKYITNNTETSQTPP